MSYSVIPTAKLYVMSILIRYGGYKYRFMQNTIHQLKENTLVYKLIFSSQSLSVSHCHFENMYTSIFLMLLVTSSSFSFQKTGAINIPWCSTCVEHSGFYANMFRSFLTFEMAIKHHSTKYLCVQDYQRNPDWILLHGYMTTKSCEQENESVIVSR